MRTRTRATSPNTLQATTPEVAALPIAVLFLAQPSCAFCDHAKAVLEDLAEQYPLSVREIAFDSTEGRQLALTHGVPFAPGIFINGTLASYGRPSLRRLHRQLSAQSTRP